MNIVKLLEELTTLEKEIIEDPDYIKQRREELNKTKHKRNMNPKNESLVYKVIGTYKADNAIHQIIRNDKKRLYRIRYYVEDNKARMTTKPMINLSSAVSALFRKFPTAERIIEEE